MTALEKPVLRQQAPVEVQAKSPLENLLDSLLQEHKGHPSNYFASNCRVCQFNAMYHIERQDKDANKAMMFLQGINSETINAAINDVNTALGETLVEPIGKVVE